MKPENAEAPKSKSCYGQRWKNRNVNVKPTARRGRVTSPLANYLPSNDSEPNMEATTRFFTKLRKLAVTLESETNKLQHSFENRNNDDDSGE